MAKGIRVGTFDPSTGAQIPVEFVHKVVWYSDDLKKFLITDENNAILKEFNFPQFRKFYDANVITYTNAGIQAHMEQELLTYEKQQMPATTNYDDDIQYEDDYIEEEYDDSGYQPHGDNNGEYVYNTTSTGRRISSRRDSSNTGANMMDANGQKMKDPSKHIGAFFLVTFIVSIVAFIVLNFGEPIVAAVSTLLS